MLRREVWVVGFTLLAVVGEARAEPPAPPPSSSAAAGPAPAPVAPVAREGAEPIVVLMVDTTTAFEQAEALSVVLRREVDATPGYFVENQPLALGVLRTTMGCSMPIDSACEARIATELSAKRIVWAHLDLVDRDVTGTLHFYREGQPPRSVPLRYAANLTEPADETLVEIARRALADVGAGPPGGFLKIDAPGITGEVFVGDQKIGVLEGGAGRFEVPAGAHRVRVRRSDGVELAGDVTVAPWKEASLALAPPPPETRGPDAKIFVGFGLLGLGAGFAVGGLYSSLQVSSNQTEFDERYKERFPSTVDACATPGGDRGVQQLCDNSEKHVVLQAVFYPLAGVAAGAGATLLALSDWSGSSASESALVVVPVVSPETAGVVVGSRF